MGDATQSFRTSTPNWSYRVYPLENLAIFLQTHTLLPNSMSLNLLVIRTPDPERLKAQYEQLGLSFEGHKHGKGPFHYACEQEGVVLEIYPLTASQQQADAGLRLGFGVHELDKLLKKLSQSDWKCLGPPTQSEWGYRAVIQDRDGRKIELLEK